MSFYRVGSNKRKKSLMRKRPGWDDSVNDLTVFRATPEEMFLRKEAHKSKNHISVKLEKLRKERQKSKMTGAEAQQLAIMKEVLYDQHELQKVLAKSDSMMAVVKDLFGDDPKRFVGFPNVTSAPQSDAEPNKSSSLPASVPDIYTRTEKLSDTVMSQSALNDIETNSDSESGSDEESERPQPISYQPKMNLQRFQDFLQEEEQLSSRMDPPSLVSQLRKQEEEEEKYGAKGRQGQQEQDYDGQQARDVAGAATSSGLSVPSQGKGEMMQLLTSLLSQGRSDQGHARDAQMLSALVNAVTAKTKEESGLKTPPRNAQSPRLPSERTPPSAMNDTKKLKKTKRCTKASESHSESVNTSASMNGMRQVLQELESEIAAYEHQTGRSRQEESNKTETFSGYTIALVSAVSRLTKYLKETDLRVRTEVTLREQLTQDVYQLRTIIDALATDIILTQEEYGKLYSEHQRYKDNTTAALTSINNQLRELRPATSGKQVDIDVEPQRKFSPQQSQQQQQQQQEQQHFNTSNGSRKTDDSILSTPIPNQQDSSTQSGSGSYQLLPSQVRPSNSIAAATSVVAASAAVMLSPPVRKTRVHTNNADLPTASQAKFSHPQSSVVNVVELPRRELDPPHLTQTPPVMNTVSVPRPIPLVQTNVNVALPGDQHITGPVAHSQPSRNPPSQPASEPDNRASLSQQGKGSTSVKPATERQSASQLPGREMLPATGHQPVPGPDLSDLVKLGDETEEQLHRLQELAVEEAMSNPALQELMQTQIAELNRQQEEARQRLLDLLDKQKLQQTRIQQHFQDPQSGDATVSVQGQKQGSGSGQQVCRSQVSPPISPIADKPEQNPQALHSRGGIIVSLPTVDLDVSGGSLTSPPRAGAQPVK